jgi:hypothetical protein
LDQLKPQATQEQLQPQATKEQLQPQATKEQLQPQATEEQLQPQATKPSPALWGESVRLPARSETGLCWPKETMTITFSRSSL